MILLRSLAIGGLVAAIIPTVLVTGWALIFSALLLSGTLALIMIAGMGLIVVEAKLLVALLPQAVRDRAGL